MRRAARIGAWTAAGVLVILLGRTVAYALNPSPLAQMLEHRAGGPSLPVLALVALTVGGSAAVLLCWLAALGVRERALLEARALSSPLPQLRTGRVLTTAVSLWLLTSLVGGLVEAYLHWRMGLGWHGLRCLVGPVHRDLLPIFGALSLVAAAVIATADLVVAWMRRTFAELRRAKTRFPLFPSLQRAGPVAPPAGRLCPSRGLARAPPSAC